jgi:hypothetical protein
LFETETVLLARRNAEQLEILSDRSDLVLNKLATLFNTDNDFINSSLYATGRGSSSNKRLMAINNAFIEVLNA